MKNVLSKIGRNYAEAFDDVLQSCLVEFINAQCEEFGVNDNFLNMTQTVYIWLVTENLQLYKFLSEKIEMINK